MKKNILVIGGFVVVGLAVLALLNYKKKLNSEKLIKSEVDSADVEESTDEIEKEVVKQAKASTPSTPSTSSTPSTPTVAIDKNKILKLGVKSDEVKILQKALNRLDNDGDFGEATRKRLNDVFLLDEITLNKYNILRPKSNYVVLIHNRGRKIDVNKLYNFELGFLKAWSQAIVNNEPVFMYNIYNYDSLTGNKTNKSIINDPFKF